MKPTGVLMLVPSTGLGGGIERFAATIESTLRAENVEYQRLDLIDGPGEPNTVRSRIRFVRKVLRTLRQSPIPLRLVIVHRNLLPIVRFAARTRSYRGTVVVVHGSEIWESTRIRGASTMRRPDVRVVAVSSFTAGALARTCNASALPPGVSAQWYQTLVDAADRAGEADGDTVRLVTAFRLDDWRFKGLPTIVEALRLIDDQRIELTVCGSGTVSDQMAEVMAGYPRCKVAANLTDEQLAEQFAAADLFVLATRTRSGDSASGEGFGLVLLEAQLAGTPVVAPAFGGSADAFLRGFTGEAPRDETARALADLIGELLGDPARLAQLKSSAAAWSRSLFAPRNYRRRLLGAFLGDLEELAATDLAEPAPAEAVGLATAVSS